MTNFFVHVSRTAVLPLFWAERPAPVRVGDARRDHLNASSARVCTTCRCFLPSMRLRQGSCARVPDETFHAWDDNALGAW